MEQKLPVVAIVGRTNVGKSSLFNAIAGRRLAVVEDSPGVTRDRNYTTVKRFDDPFVLVDTGGLIGEEDSCLHDSVRVQAELAIAEASIVICVFDCLAGPTPYDQEIADRLRATKKPILWVVNKCEKPSSQNLAYEFCGLGLDNVIPVSAAHMLGLHDILRELKNMLPQITRPEVQVTESKAEVARQAPIRIAVLGKPNVGKSTLINKILGEERLVTSNIAGTTRDKIDIHLSREGRDYIIVDTAGLRRPARITAETVERYSNVRTLRALIQSDVAVVVLDATLGMPSDQDARIAGLIHDRGRGLVFVVNKWDAVEKDHRTVKEFEEAIYEVFKFARYAPIVFVSALSGRRCPAVLTTATKVYEAARVRIPTSELNRVLKRAFERRPPPVYHGQPIKLFFATQIAVAPPTIVLFTNQPKKLGFAYERYLKNELRDTFDFTGVDLKLEIKKRTEKAETGRVSRNEKIQAKNVTRRNIKAGDDANEMADIEFGDEGTSEPEDEVLESIVPEDEHTVVEESDIEEVVGDEEGVAENS